MKNLALLLSLVCLATTSASAEFPAGWKLASNSESLIHVDSGLAFPPKWNGMLRVNPSTYDQQGLNVSIGYNAAENRLALTLYLYPSSYGGTPDPEEHFKGVLGAAVQSHPGAQVEKAVRMELPLGSATSTGFNAFLHWAEPSGEAGSFLILIPQQDRFLKLRASFELDQDPEAIKKVWERVTEFLRSLKLESPS
jgi:hypothetical protein